MNTTRIKRLRARDEDQADHYALKLRRLGRSAWAETEGGQHFVCLRVQVVRIRADLTFAPHRFN